jgi:hypothetical protein
MSRGTLLNLAVVLVVGVASGECLRVRVLFLSRALSTPLCVASAGWLVDVLC